MKCPECASENLETQKFCGRCGAKLERVCPKCGSGNPLDYSFCGECGGKLGKTLEPERAVPEPEGERKYVTVLFSDLSGYTAMSEKLDPEEVKEILSRIFGEIAQVVARYEGFIEKFIGDAVMALFGVPRSHEDDPVRAIRAAREIHDIVEGLSPELEKKIGRPISMHTGINTGLVVTGKTDAEKGIHGASGDTINLASRLQGLAGRGEILVGHDTYRQTEGYFSFESLEPTMVKGKTEPVQVHKVLSRKDKPVTTHRLSGMRADLIGRKKEMEELKEAVSNLKKGRGRIFSICGDAGTGKSRLVEDFKAALDLGEIQWVEGHAYAYSQNIPYFTLIDLLNRVFQIEENDAPQKVREKIESRLGRLIERHEDLIPYLGSLYSLHYPEVKEVSPEFWRSRLQEAIKAVFGALAKKAPTVFFLEDLHWADPSFVDLFRRILMEIRQPAIVLCVYRPTFNLFTSHQLTAVEKVYREIRLQDLSLSDAQDMLASLLKAENIPSDLSRLVQTKTEGNPFYLEELVNSLIESGALVREDGDWRVTRPLNEMEISSSIHGLISGRLDRLETETKRILQEASVIGRAFLYEILLKITELRDRLEPGLSTLQRLDLIRTRSLEPDLEYMFKHPLTQEVVYNGLLKKERQRIHEKIGLVMELLFHERLSEFYETLAYHFKQGRSLNKGVHYLIKSGEKSLGRYALEESYQYFKEAFEILSNNEDRTDDEDTLLITLIVKWAYVHYYIGDFKSLTGLLSAHQSLAENMRDRSVAGMFYGWLGMALWSREAHRESLQQLLRALQIGEELNDRKVIGYACAWLTWTCAELGLFEDALKFGKRAQDIAKHFPGDHYLFFKSLGGIGFTHYCRGEGKKAIEAGNTLVEFGEQNSDIRSMVMGHYVRGLGYYLLGDLRSGVESEERAVQISVDPYYRQFPMVFIGIGSFLNGEFEKARAVLEEVAAFSETCGVEGLGTPVKALLGAVLLSTGELKRGLAMIEDSRRRFEEKGRKWCIGLVELMMGQFYVQVANRSGEKNVPSMLKNLPFLISGLPSANKKAKQHFQNCIDISEEIGAQALAGEAYLNLGLLQKSKGRKEEAMGLFSEAIRCFEKGELDKPLQQAREAIASLG